MVDQHGAEGESGGAVGAFKLHLYVLVCFLAFTPVQTVLQSTTVMLIRCHMDIISEYQEFASVCAKKKSLFVEEVEGGRSESICD